ncbi:MAG TPA: redoxin family protein [Vicinamibacteria bacterium]|jgi:cytochrome c biogenesis protein CcmG/thiol:disulfide interchange protein DsbE
MNRKVLGAGLLVALPLLALLVVNLGRDPHAMGSPLVGKKAPPFSLSPLEGGDPITLDSLRGRAVVLNFWATWCVPCMEEHEALVAGAARHADTVRFLGVVYEDDPGAVRRFLRERGQAFPSVLDQAGRTAIAYGVYGVPETYFIDAGGTIVAKQVGPLDPDALEAHLQKALGGSS